MADESEKKPEFVVIKKEKKPETQSEKKVVVVKRKPAAPEKQKKVAVRVVAKKAPETSAKPEEKPVAEKTKETAVQQTAPKVAAPVQEKPAERKVENNSERPQQQNKPQRQSFEINSARPNVRAGNLSGSGSRGGYGNRYNSGYGNNRGSGFTGAQAREGYQNRERSGGYNNNRGGNGFNGNGANRQGGFNGNRGGNGFNGNGANRQGGFNNNRQGGGFNRQGGGFGGSRPGFGGSRPGFGGGSSFVPPAPIPQGKTPAKKQFKGKKQDYSQRKDKEEFFDEEELYKKKKESTPANVVPPTIDIMETISVSDLARKMNLKAGEIIGKLMSMGMMVTINQSIDSDTATILAEEYNCKVHLISLYDETVIESDKGNAEGERSRPPIVTVMGHVDHGKTKTLDAIRDANVAAGEAGGITQKIGAYRVSTPKGDITFLDTPGHEAFTMMRARGAQITDIVILVVAADDGVMPQTLEAIHHAKDAKVPIIVAVNKMDKPDANPERVMTQLSEHGLTPEAWGGDTQYVNISALKREGIDELLDAVLIQAEMLELKAQYDCRAEGKVIESRIDQGRGVVASVIIERGTLRTGDPFVAGIYSGRVRAMFNDKGQKITEAGPCTPVEVLGIENMPNAGDPFQVTESEKDARAFAAKRQELKRFEDAKAVKKVTLDNLYSTIEASEVKEFKVIIKADLQGSAEALKASLEKLSTKEIRLSVIHSSAGAINESDVTLAAADSNAIIIGFNVRPTPKAKALAEQEKVEIRKYNIIYKCVEEIQQAMEGMLQPDTKEEVTGTIEVLNTFKVPKVGLIAGCMVRDGIVKRTSYVNVIRDGVVVCSAAKVSSLKRFKDDAKEVREGFECGLGIENWQDIQVGDTIEAFEYIEVKRKLGQTLAEEQAEAEKHQASDSGESQEN
ncbi:MAG: translation initiation factor IF-2 [Treponema sp.]|nr:translation initiation factor IF-2 [Treponema sp.]